MSTQISELSLELRERMRGVSWHADLPSPSFDELRVLRIPYRDFSGDEQLGELITVKALAAEVVDIFAGLFAIDFRNTNRISLHALGRAIDINPIQNPVIRDGIVRPDAGKPYCDRSRQEPGMFSGTCDATKVFLSAGWKWGGNWDNPKDYHHFFREAE